MKNMLRKIRLFDDFTIELEISKNDFYRILKNNIDEKQPDFFDPFTSSKNEYKGVVTYDKFEIKRKLRLFDMNFNFAVAKGQIEEKNSRLIIDTEVNVFQGKIMFFFILLIIFYSIFIIAFSTADNINGNAPEFALPFIILHATFMFGIPYLILRRNVSRMKYELERDLYFLIKKK